MEKHKKLGVLCYSQSNVQMMPHMFYYHPSIIKCSLIIYQNETNGLYQSSNKHLAYNAVLETFTSFFGLSIPILAPISEIGLALNVMANNLLYRYTCKRKSDLFKGQNEEPQAYKKAI